MAVSSRRAARGRMLVPALVALIALGASGGCSQRVEPERDESGAIAETASNADVFSIKLGDCTNDGEEMSGETSTVEAVPCTQEHDNEVYAVFDLPDGSFPGDDEVQTKAAEGCLAEFEDFIGAPYEESIYDYFPMTPTEGSWRAGDREVLCLAYHGGLAKVTGSLEGIGS